VRHVATLLALCCLSHVTNAQAQRGSRSDAPSPDATLTLRGHLGIDVSVALLRSQNPLDRQRGFERLGDIGTAQALDLLLKAFDLGGAARSAKDRLIAVRALAPHGAVPAVRDFLVRVMVGVGSNPERAEAIDGMIERAAALTLAETGDDTALIALGKALRQPGHVADTARDALLAFPPRNLLPLLSDLRSPTRAFASVLGELGDARAIPALRELVRSGPSDVRPEAALALAKLGVTETLELARYWLLHDKRADFQAAAARLLVLFRAPDAAAAVSRLLADETNRALGVELAASASLPALSGPLLQLARSGPLDERSALFSALARTGTREAFSFLGGALSARDTSSAAGLALALSPDSQADAALERALARSNTRRTAVRASIVRQLAQGRTPSGFDAALAELSRSNDASDRAVFVTARALGSISALPDLLKHAKVSELLALSRLALMPQAAPALADRLATEQDPVLRAALAASLVSTAAAERVPSRVLLSLVESGGLASPLAARALASRDSATLRPAISSLLRSSDTLLRGQVALGLGQSEDGSALGLLEQAYRFETDGGVRLAIVRAIASRPEPARRRALNLARTLDAAAEVRQAAARALQGAPPEQGTYGRDTVWIDFSSLPEPALGTTPMQSALIITDSGAALPAFADPDGVLLFPALPKGSFELRLAAPARSEDSHGPRSP
jgi:HEAT repeat protein